MYKKIMMLILLTECRTFAAFEHFSCGGLPQQKYGFEKDGYVLDDCNNRMYRFKFYTVDEQLEKIYPIEGVIYYSFDWSEKPDRIFHVVHENGEMQDIECDISDHQYFSEDLAKSFWQQYLAKNFRPGCVQLPS